MLKEQLFAHVKAVEAGDQKMETATYGGVLVQNKPPIYAHLTLEFRQENGHKPKPTAAEARKALVTLATYYGKTPAIEADAALVKELGQNFGDVMDAWWQGLQS
uniref:Uncharacterized protein n=1 Tax=Dinoroseobacter phage vB_DshS_R26L TaxID=3161158 RepID=A0AAU7VGJ7_9CAUD